MQREHFPNAHIVHMQRLPFMQRTIELRKRHPRRKETTVNSMRRRARMHYPGSILYNADMYCPVHDLGRKETIVKSSLDVSSFSCFNARFNATIHKSNGCERRKEEYRQEEAKPKRFITKEIRCQANDAKDAEAVVSS
jgi:hypothetical protein